MHHASTVIQESNSVLREMFLLKKTKVGIFATVINGTVMSASFRVFFFRESPFQNFKSKQCFSVLPQGPFSLFSRGMSGGLQ